MSLSEVPVLSASPNMHKSHKSSKSVNTICGHTIPKHPQDQGTGYPITSVKHGSVNLFKLDLPHP
jgi:hypothetical protein